MPNSSGYTNLGVTKKVRAQVQAFRGQLMQHSGEFVTVSEAISIAMRELDGEAERIARERLPREAERVS